MRISLVILMFSYCCITWAQTPQAGCVTEEHRQFDFWLGTWGVTTPDGKAAGVNVIQNIQNGCVLQENWTSAAGNFTGTSFNFYNSTLKRWEQLWLDNQGGSLKLFGNRKGDQMILASEPAPETGVIQRITWTMNEDRSVRQLWERVNGEEVNIVFDGLYKPTEE